MSYLSGEMPASLPMELMMNTFKDQKHSPYFCCIFLLPLLIVSILIKTSTTHAESNQTQQPIFGYDVIYDMTTDSEGNIYITGVTSSINVPTLNAFQPNRHGSDDAFVAKFSSDMELVFSTYIGGFGSEVGRGIDLDQQGNVYIVGETSSNDFPIINAFQTENNGNGDFFITKLSANGNIEFSTYFGGEGQESDVSFSLDSSDNIYLVGSTDSLNLFTTTDAFQSELQGDQDVIFAKVNPFNYQVIYSTYLGGTERDTSGDIEHDIFGNVFLAGNSSSEDFPTINATFPSIDNDTAFVTKFNENNLSIPLISTFLDDNAGRIGEIAFDLDGNLYLAGGNQGSPQNSFLTKITGGLDSVFYRLSFPEEYLIHDISLDSMGTINIGGEIVSSVPSYETIPIVIKVSSEGIIIKETSLTFVEEPSHEATIFRVIVNDFAERTFLAGITGSPTLPLVNPYQATLGAPSDGFITKLSPDWETIEYSTYFGGFHDPYPSPNPTDIDFVNLQQGEQPNWVWSDWLLLAAFISLFGLTGKRYGARWANRS
jgi:hypothetical protein